jgi:hypothetical protein
MISVASSIKMDILPGSMLLSTTFSLAGSKAGSDESTTNLTIHLFHRKLHTHFLSNSNYTFFTFLHKTPMLE